MKKEKQVSPLKLRRWFRILLFAHTILSTLSFVVGVGTIYWLLGYLKLHTVSKCIGYLVGFFPGMAIIMLVISVLIDIEIKDTKNDLDSNLVILYCHMARFMTIMLSILWLLVAVLQVLFLYLLNTLK